MILKRKVGDRLAGGSFDMHKAISKLPAPKRGWTLPGHNYISPYTPLDRQLSYDPETGVIQHIYQQPSGPSDAVAMQHDMDYGLCSYRSQKYGEHERTLPTE